MTPGDSERPWVSARLPGVGGRIKAGAADFVVEEVPLYAASGSGEHVFVLHRRALRTTREVQADLARAFGLPLHAVGVAGQKDKVAVATQTFSLHLPRLDEAVVRERLSAVAGEVLDVRRHANKLRIGHLRGNRFTIVLEGAHDLAAAQAIAAELVRAGLPNFFGPQRLGAGGRHVEAGRRALARGRRGWRARLEVSALQAALFDCWLDERIARGDFGRILPGDIAKRTADGALFLVEDLAAEAERCARREIVATGPIFGSKMRAAQDLAGEHERAVLRAADLSPEDFAASDAPGSRRASRIDLDALDVHAHARGLELRFQLPKGAYATVVMREFTRLPGAESSANDGGGEEDELDVEA